MIQPVKAEVRPATLSSLLADVGSETVFSACDILRLHPDLWGQPSLVVQLAYEEYCRRIEAGEAVQPAEFAQRFSPVESSLLKQIEVHGCLDELVRGAGTPAPAAALRPGDEALGFELVEEIGRGAFSRVFLARETRLGRRSVVVKLCSDGADEASTIATLEHPNVVPVLHVKHDDLTGVSAICMPFQGRLTLQHLIRGNEPAGGAARCEFPLPRLARGPLPDVVARVAEDVAAALIHIHAAGFQHGDIKPSNILVGDDGVARLLDFNLARPQQGDERRLGGTLPYMPPELLEGMFRPQDAERGVRPDPRSELYSLGATLYHVLAGVCPFGTRETDEHPEAAALRLLAAPPAANLKDVNPEVDAALASLIHDCLARDPNDRPQSAEEVARRLRQRRRLVPTLWRAGRRRPVLRNTIAAGIVVAASLTAWLAATAEPYGERQLRAGWKAFVEKRYDAAIRHFDSANQSRQPPAGALYGRAVSRLAAGSPELACADFEQLHSFADTPEAAEGLAYCLASARKDYAQAIQLYENILASRPSDPAVLNNVGYCHLQSGHPDRALPYLKNAVAADPRLQPAHHNLAVAELRLSSVPGKERMPDLSHITAATKLGPPTAELSFTVAMTYAVAGAIARRDGSTRADEFERQAIAAAEESLTRGLSPARLNNLLGFWKDLGDTSPIVRLSSRSPAKAGTPAIRLINPAESLRPTDFDRPHGSSGHVAIRP